MAVHRHNGASENRVTITFEHCTARSTKATSSSRSSSAYSTAPSTPTDQLPSYPLDSSDASEDSWNLIPYDVPWGPEYYHYKVGSLPGPDGACIFLRSPTPLKNRRTQRACNKCRQRKAKCSGARPACSRCVARGYSCEYAEDEKRPSHGSGRSRHRREQSEELSDDDEDSWPEADHPSPAEESQPFVTQPLKIEEADMATPDLLYPDNCSTSDSGSNSTGFSPVWDHAAYTTEAPCGYESPSSFHEANAAADYYNSPSYAVDVDMQTYHPENISPIHPSSEGASQHPAAAVHAPRPVRCVGSPSFLTPEEQPATFSSSCEAQIFQHDDMLINLPSTAEPAPQIAIPQIPPMPSADLAAVQGGAFEYVHPQAMYYCPAPMPQYPFLQYQYGVPGYMPGLQDNVEPTMLYTMVPTGMAS
ncbi:hypothetical protein ONZ51_g6105 [Trametes cubensis]|uniref:Zn(2)-C6 fungal-type domain-containing protein n=1 Tax=Trametes cubensis TaxID=1111947 RepID=A0AAD7XBE3_9APHY|nr:hypothetical protein ONZ51_g6105 [Trametes cubensis]